MARKIGVLEPVWNQEYFIKPHFQMLADAGVDKMVVLRPEKPLTQYREEHGYSDTPDRSFDLIEKHFPQIEVHPSTYEGDFGALLYNEGLKYVKDCDIVFILDTDMLFTKKDMFKMISFIRSTDYDCYRLNYVTNSINYYKDFDHGLMDAKEHDPRAINPKYELEPVLNYPSNNTYLMEWEGFMCHHFRGWNKPKTITKDWEDTEYARRAFSEYSNNGEWYRAPEEIRDMFDKDTIKRWGDHVCVSL